MKIDFAKIGEKTVTLWNTYKPELIKAGKLAVGAIITALTKTGLEKLGISSADVPSTSNVINFTPSYKSYSPETAKESGMYAIYRPAMRMNSDYYRKNEAEKIYVMAKNGTDDEKKFAIDLLSDLASAMSSSYYSGEVLDYIKILAQ